MTVSFYGLTIPPDVFIIATETLGDYNLDTRFPIYGNTSAPQNSRYSYFSTDEKNRTMHFSGMSNGLFHPVHRLSMALKEATTSSECEA
ncbi:hypothetical protein [Sodalis sp. dw_96]|uniref:hypothetical protein n=1 Tax=Sodalis sp. dw_96 TaxID=2719794 RepID=UPI001BD48278|nr:hypothetical protein [Sodalis sp. dw_96]